MSARRGISRTTIRSVYATHGGICAFPDCPFPASTDDGMPLVQIAHIRPLAVSGPRGGELISYEKVEAEDNLILLCPYHHMLIDTDPSAYPTERVTEIRDKHISRVARILASTNRASGPSAPAVSKPAVSRIEWALSQWETERGNSSEEFWQQMFDSRPELLSVASYGRASTLNSKCYVGGKAINNRGGNVLDFIAQNHGDVVLIEIKTPTAKLLGSEYRNNVYPPSSELAGAVTQALYSRLSLLTELNALKANSPDLRVHFPSIFLLIGDADREDMSETQRRSFELFRTSLKDVTIQTYDELFDGIKTLAVWMEPS
jgi:hypothetical protein